MLSFCVRIGTRISLRDKQLFEITEVEIMSRLYFKRKQSSHDLSARSSSIAELRKEPGRVAQSVGHLTRKSEVLGSIPGLSTSWYDWNTVKKGVKSKMIHPSNTVKTLIKYDKLSFPVSRFPFSRYNQFPVILIDKPSRSNGLSFNHFIEFKGKGCCRRQETSAIKLFTIVGGLHRNVLLMRKQP